MYAIRSYYGRKAGVSVSAIAREFDLDRKTVRSCLRQTEWSPYRRQADARITSYNVCYTKLLRLSGGFCPTSFPLFQASRLLIVSIFDSLVVGRSHMFDLRGNGCCGVGSPTRAVGHQLPVTVTSKFLVPGGIEWLVFGNQSYNFV